jgi:hypothetical protein
LLVLISFTQTFVAAGVTSGDDVQVRCTISSVSVTVPGRYLLQLPLPFRIHDEAESVKFSSKKQPATLTVTMTVEGSIQQQQQHPAPNSPGPQLSPAAAASTIGSSGSRGSKGRRRQQGQQQQQAAEATHSSSSSTALFASDEQFLGAVVFAGPIYDRR